MREFLVFLAIWVNASAALGQVLYVNQSTSCEGSPTTFYIAYPKAIKAYDKAELIFGDGQSVDLLKFQNPKAHHYYYKPGTYKPVLKLTEANQASESFKTDAIEILEGPDFKMLLSGKDSQCFKENRFVWQGPWKSAAGSDLSKWEWDFGDGNKINARSPEHSYGNPGTYEVSLTCRDENGCEQKQTREVTVHDSFRVRFTLKQDSMIPGSPVKFTNLSTIDSTNIASWVWDWGANRRKKDTFSFDSAKYLWNHFSRKYGKDGYSSPKLVVRSKSNCLDSLLLKDAIRIISFRFDVTWIPSIPTPCFHKNQVRFNMAPRPNATQLNWSFGDSLDVPRTNYNQRDWSPSHHYTQPGYYNVNFQILEPPVLKDTTVCFIKVKGPMAKILRNEKRNSYTPMKAIAASEYQQLKEDIHYRLRSGKDSIRYWRIKKVPSYVVDSVPEYENAPMQVSREVESTCQGDTVWRPTYKLEPTSYRKVFQDYLLIDSGYWNYQSSIPSDTLYHPPSGRHYMHNMHDTDLYHPAPFNMVQFSNNSIKYRLWGDSLKSQKPLSLRYAWDNIPGEFPDKGRNPNYPWASDSMAYFWDFDDDKAPQCTSTVNKPNTRCAYSTEVAPKHLYRDMGVYHAILGVYDPVCNCSDSDTVAITMIHPNLTPSAGKVFNWYQQDRFDSLGKNINLGFRIRGDNCVSHWADQKPDFTELGIDLEHIDNYWLVFDADEQCDTVFYSFDDKGATRDSFYLDCDWISKKEFEADKSIYNYKSGGWKSIGVVLKIGNVFDTLFIKNYKWVYHPKLQIELDYDIKPLSDSFELKMTWRDSTSMYDSMDIFQFYISSFREESNGIFFDSLKFPEGKETSISLQLSTPSSHRLSWGGRSNEKEKLCFSYAPIFLPKNTVAYFKIEEPNICVNQNIKFEESVFYLEIQKSRWYTKSETYGNQWTNSKELRKPDKDLFNDVVRAETRLKWLKNANYKLPEFEEQLAWDFDGDSIFDAYGNQPSWSYPEPGTYHPKLYVRDSTGFWLRVGIDEPIHVNGAGSEIVANNSQKAFVCTGLPLQLSTVSDTAVVISKYRWNVAPSGTFGSQSNFQWIPETAGTYTISLSTETIDGCKEQSTYGPITVRSPKARFQIAPYQDSCTQLEFELQNTSIDTDSLYWLLNGNVLAKTSAENNTFNLHLPYYGNHFISQFATGQLYDSTRNKYVTCTDAYPKDDKVKLDIPGNPNSDFRVLRELSDWGTLAFTAIEKKADIYLWTFDGSMRVSKSDTTWYQNGRNGDYEVCLEVIKGEAECTSKTCKTVWLRDLGLEIPTSTQIRVSPTLVKSYFSIETLSSEPEGGSYQVFDISGMLVHSGRIETTSTTVNITQLPAGAYFLTVQVNDTVQAVKLIKL